MTSDTNHAFFRPLWRRVAIVAVCVVWSLVEWANGQTVWGAMTLAIAAYGVWVFFIKYDPTPPPGEDPNPPRT